MAATSTTSSTTTSSTTTSRKVSPKKEETDRKQSPKHLGVFISTQDTVPVVFSGPTNADRTMRCKGCGDNRHETVACPSVAKGLYCGFCRDVRTSSGIHKTPHNMFGCRMLPKCKTCGVPHHKKFTCDRPICVKCGLKGTHLSDECKETACENCGVFWHITENCRQCDDCGIWGHTKRFCDTPYCQKCRDYKQSDHCDECDKDCGTLYCNTCCEITGADPWGHSYGTKCPNVYCSYCGGDEGCGHSEFDPEKCPNYQYNPRHLRPRVDRKVFAKKPYVNKSFDKVSTAKPSAKSFTKPSAR
jgi:hypothetical protein